MLSCSESDRESAAGGYRFYDNEFFRRIQYRELSRAQLELDCQPVEFPEDFRAALAEG